MAGLSTTHSLAFPRFIPKRLRAKFPTHASVIQLSNREARLRPEFSWLGINLIMNWPIECGIALGDMRPCGWDGWIESRTGASATGLSERRIDSVYVYLYAI